jgi:mannan endo-1,4-beta-mannosidase
MKPTFKYMFFFICSCVFIACNTQKKENDISFLPSDKKATKETVELFETLHSRMENGIMLGHQDDLAYGNKWYGEPGRSDVKAVCGDYPAVFGWNIGNLETDSAYNSDSISFAKLRNYIKLVNKIKGVSILTWTAHNPAFGNSENQPDNDYVRLILQNKSVREKYIIYLDKVASFFNSLKDKDGDYIPIVFQPFNEYNISGKNWWSKDKCSSTDYKKLYTFTVNYLRDNKNIHHVLYLYSIQADTAVSAFTDSYPGNNYVDLVGVSLNLDQDEDPSGKIYVQTLNQNLSIITQFAEKNNKIAALTNTGMKGIKLPDYFSNYLYPIISQYKLSYIMFGKNAWNDEKLYFIPIPGHPASEDFASFSKNPRILTCKKISL